MQARWIAAIVAIAVLTFFVWACLDHGGGKPGRLPSVPQNASSATSQSEANDSQKRAAVDHAKQLSLAAMMYTNDNDDRWPLDSDSLRPYLRDEAALAGFVYERPAQGKSGDTPNDQEIGYVQATGGRAIVTAADTQCHWAPTE